LERLPGVRRVFFDKTGTLTRGQMTVEEITCAVESVSPGEALAWAAAIEAGSEHTIAGAIVDAARSRGLSIGEVSDFKVFPGLGVQGMVTLDGQARLVTAGSSKLLNPASLPINHCPSPNPDRTTIFVAWEGVVQAAISLSDTARPEAEEVIRHLQAAGMRTAVISGDRGEPTRRLAAQLGIADVFWQCSPEDKADVIRKARKLGQCVAMVGDGINDAPALSEADIAIATGGGTDLARQSSDLTLLGDDLTRIPWVLDMSRLTYSIIRQNLAWAFGYNAAAICLAFFGLVHPLIAAAAMVVSSLTVVLNSMRLTSKR
jgi:P-type E1-E2 ATPase